MHINIPTDADDDLIAGPPLPLGATSEDDVDDVAEPVSILTPAEIDEIEARANKATPGPWAYTSLGDGYDEGRFLGADGALVCSFGEGDSIPESNLPGDPPSDADEAFIAHARTDVPALVATVRALREALDAATEGWRAEVTSYWAGEVNELREQFGLPPLE